VTRPFLDHCFQKKFPEMSAILPNYLLKLMAPADRKALGKAGVTAEEAIAKAAL
jgi:hypothetical protein